MDDLNAAYIAEQEELSSAGAWIWLVEISKADQPTLRYTNNNAVGGDGTHLYTTWDGYDYYTAPLAMDDVEASLQGKFPEYKLSIGAVSLTSALRTALPAANGYIGGTVRLMVVHSAHLNLTTPAINEYATILNCEATAEAVVFTIGVPSLLSRRFPRDRYVPSFCRHKFGNAFCGYRDNTHILVSGQVAFTKTSGVWAMWVTEGGLIDEIFKHVVGRTIYLSGVPLREKCTLPHDVAFTVKDTVYNNGVFTADHDYPVDSQYVYVLSRFVNANGNLQKIVTEHGGWATVIITLGYTACDHTLEACKLRDNVARYGGSPGVAGGMYG